MEIRWYRSLLPTNRFWQLRRDRKCLRESSIMGSRIRCSRVVSAAQAAIFVSIILLAQVTLGLLRLTNRLTRAQGISRFCP